MVSVPMEALSPSKSEISTLISSPTEGASVIAYASVVDNRSGDPVTIPAQPAGP